MNQRASLLRRGMTLAALLAVAGVSFEFGAVQNSAPVQPKTGLVDFNALFELSPQGIAGRAKLKEQREVYQERIDRRSKQIEAAKASLSKFKAGTLDHARVQIDISGLERTTLSLKEAYEQDILNQEGKRWLGLYHVFEQAIEKVAVARKLDLVLKSLAVGPDDSPRLRFSLLENRQIWFSNPAMDITDAVLNQLKVEAAKAGGPGPGGAAKADGK